MKSRLRIVVVVVGLAACRGGSTGAPTAASEETEASKASAPEAAEPTDASEPTSEVADDLPPPWWTPLPSISLGPLTKEELAGSMACISPERAASEDVTAEELFAAAQCLGQHRAFGKEVVMYRVLLDRFPHAPNVPDVQIAMGRRYEQVDRPWDAVRAYARLVKLYPKHEDAEALGKRVVCLARSLDDPDTAQSMLQDLQRLFGRARRFVPPPEAALDQLCAGLPRPEESRPTSTERAG